MKTQMALALTLPLVWSGLWFSLTRKHVVKSHWRRVLLVAVWVALGFLLRARGIDPHVPGVWELFLFPILPFLQISRFTHAAYMNGVPADQMVSYEVFGMVVGFAIVAECVFIHRFVWTGYQLGNAQAQKEEAESEEPAEVTLSQNGTASLNWMKMVVVGVSLGALLWQFFLWMMRGQARVDALG